jgi:hypothetical protein
MIHLLSVLLQDMLFDPVALGCGHLFCNSCACSAASVAPFLGAKAARRSAQCPLCRQVYKLGTSPASLDCWIVKHVYVWVWTLPVKLFSILSLKHPLGLTWTLQDSDLDGLTISYSCCQLHLTSLLKLLWVLPKSLIIRFGKGSQVVIRSLRRIWCSCSGASMQMLSDWMSLPSLSVTGNETVCI